MAARGINTGVSDASSSSSASSTGYRNPDVEALGVELVRTISHGLKELYLCRPTDDLLQQLYHRDAVFEDPLGKLSPFIAFKGLAEVFQVDELVRWDVVDVNPTGMRIEAQLKYHTRGVPIPAPFAATIIIKLDKDHKIVQHEDWWAGAPLMHADQGILGQLSEARRRLTGLMQAAFVRVTGGEKIGQSEAGGSKEAPRWQTVMHAGGSAVSSAPQQPGERR